VDDSPDCIRHVPSVGDICPKTLWVSQRIHGLLSSRGQHSERDQRTGRGRRDAQSLRASEPSIKARGIEMESRALHVCRSTTTIPLIITSVEPPSRFFNRADFADNEQIEELIVWTHPHLESPSTTGVVFTEAENATMLRLPRKECTSHFSHHLTLPHPFPPPHLFSSK